MSDVKHKSTRSDADTWAAECRFAYIYAHEKRTQDGQKKAVTPHHEIVILAPKLHNDPAQCPNYLYLQKHCMDACMRQPGWNGFPQGGHWPIKNGDNPPTPKAPQPGQAPVDPAEHAKKYAYQRGHWVIVATSYSDIGPRVCVMQAGVAHEIPARIMAGKEMYKSGDYGHPRILAYTFHNQTWGVKFGFEGVLFTRPCPDDQRIGNAGGPKSAKDMFGGIAPVAAAAPPAMHPPAGPPMYAAPPAMPPLPTSATATAPGSAVLPPAHPPVQNLQPGAPPAPAYAPTPGAPVPPTAPAPTTAYPSNPPAAPAYAPPPPAPQMSGLPPFPGR